MKLLGMPGETESTQCANCWSHGAIGKRTVGNMFLRFTAFDELCFGSSLIRKIQFLSCSTSVGKLG
jgi:hypothetical protein|uniref:Uncharacterized protein n=1 Tax=Picea glauca TaxID=3330 RepID=A0A117NG56_PICGL|nr:hypothetical protein ABT39_MTgene1786 [Picea glauca]QHR86333.1 hypothetical protein Q903MT_gene332 [Picea sitchensis]